MVVQPGEPFDPQAINELLKTLYATGLFCGVSISRDGNNLDVTVVENPTVNQVFFSGNKVLVDKDAQAAISLKPRSVFTPAGRRGRSPRPARCLCQEGLLQRHRSRRTSSACPTTA